MSYTKSNARVVFESFTTQLMSLATSTNKINAAFFSYGHKNLVYQSIFVSLCSAIEEYHKTIIEDWFYQLKASNVPMAKIHDNTRLFCLLFGTEQDFKNFLFDRDNEKKTIEKLVLKKSILKKCIDDNEHFDMDWLARNVWSNKKYPSTKNITTLYNRLGISNIFEELKKLKHKDYKMQLDSLLSIRESIAHVGAGAVTFYDVKKHVNFVKEFVYLLDKELYKHCCRVAGSAYWPK